MGVRNNIEGGIVRGKKAEKAASWSGGAKNGSPQGNKETEQGTAPLRGRKKDRLGNAGREDPRGRATGGDTGEIPRGRGQEMRAAKGCVWIGKTMWSL